MCEHKCVCVGESETWPGYKMNLESQSSGPWQTQVVRVSPNSASGMEDYTDSLQLKNA
jgi:hypothetical protein